MGMYLECMEDVVNTFDSLDGGILMGLVRISSGLVRIPFRISGSDPR